MKTEDHLTVENPITMFEGESWHVLADVYSYMCPDTKTNCHSLCVCCDLTYYDLPMKGGGVKEHLNVRCIKYDVSFSA